MSINLQISTWSFEEYLIYLEKICEQIKQQDFPIDCRKQLELTFSNLSIDQVEGFSRFILEKSKQPWDLLPTLIFYAFNSVDKDSKAKVDKILEIALENLKMSVSWKHYICLTRQRPFFARESLS